MIDQRILSAIRSRVAKVAELGMEEMQQAQQTQVPGPPTGQPAPPVDPKTGQPVAIDPTSGQPTTPPMAGAVDPNTGAPMVDPAAAQQADPSQQQQPEAPPTLDEMLQSGDPIVKLLVDMSQQLQQVVAALPQLAQIDKRMEFFAKAMGQFMDHSGMTQPSSKLVELNDKMAIEAGNAQAAAQAAEATTKKSGFADPIPNPLVDGADPDDEDDDDSFAPASGMPAAGPPPMPSPAPMLKLSSQPESVLQIGQPGLPSASSGLYVATPRAIAINKALANKRT
ncbi:MAG: hypothetical protein B7Z37_26575 [Verrucomicrobia bacterium 12-59-8]|nr:MAG: hypothetical protein B7Z37_26575 [Verrucomicrobia bacterium 12-59-8]